MSQHTPGGWRPFEECPDGVIVDLMSTKAPIERRTVGQRFNGSEFAWVIAEGCDYAKLFKIYPTHFRPIGGGK